MNLATERVCVGTTPPNPSHIVGLIQIETIYVVWDKILSVEFSLINL
jgi:hypothetical protein